MIYNSVMLLECLLFGIIIIWMMVYVLTTKSDFSREYVISKAVAAFFVISLIVCIGGLL